MLMFYINMLFFSVEPKIINIAKDDYDTTLAVIGFSHNVLCLLVKSATLYVIKLRILYW